MNLDKNELSGCWFEANKETYYALIRAECSEFGGHTYELGLEWGYWRIEGKVIIACRVDAIKNAVKKHKQAYYHNGEFYDTDPKAELTYDEQQNVAHGLGEKVPFPAMDEIATHEDENGAHLSVSIEQWLDHVLYKFIENISIKEEYEIAKTAYENGVIVTWRLKDKLADIKAKYAKAKEAEKNGGPIVKVEWRELGGEWRPIDGRKCEWSKNIEHRLRYYRINWNKVLETSYRDEKFVECEVSGDGEVWTEDTPRLVGLCQNGGFAAERQIGRSGWWQHCRLAPGVEIQDEWLEEVTDEAELEKGK